MSFLGFVCFTPFYFPLAIPCSSWVSPTVLVCCCPLLGAARPAAAQKHNTQFLMHFLEPER